MMPGEMLLGEACTCSVPAGLVVGARLLFAIGAGAGKTPEGPAAASASGLPATTALEDGDIDGSNDAGAAEGMAGTKTGVCMPDGARWGATVAGSGLPVTSAAVLLPVACCTGGCVGVNAGASPRSGASMAGAGVRASSSNWRWVLW